MGHEKIMNFQPAPQDPRASSDFNFSKTTFLELGLFTQIRMLQYPQNGNKLGM